MNKQFKARIYGTDGRPVVGASSGMEVIMTLSIIDALRTVSRLDAPVFFDTPARSLDKDHKNGMLNYFACGPFTIPHLRTHRRIHGRRNLGGRTCSVQQSMGVDVARGCARVNLAFIAVRPTFPMLERANRVGGDCGKVTEFLRTSNLRQGGGVE